MRSHSMVPHPLGGLLFTFEDVTDKFALEASYNNLIAVQRTTLNHYRFSSVFCRGASLSFVANSRSVLLYALVVSLLLRLARRQNTFAYGIDPIRSGLGVG